MRKTHLLKAAAAISGIACLSSAALAQTTEQFTASATVSSSLTITQNTPLRFGNLVVVQDGTNTARATLAANGTWTPGVQGGTENLVQIGAPTPGNFTINAGVPSFINVQVTFDNTSTLANAAAPPGNGTFTVDEFRIAAPTVGTLAATNTLAACNTAGNCRFTTSNGGLVTFPLGARISVGSATASYIDGTYSGTYDIVAAFY